MASKNKRMYTVKNVQPQFGCGVFDVMDQLSVEILGLVYEQGLAVVLLNVEVMDAPVESKETAARLVHEIQSGDEHLVFKQLGVVPEYLIWVVVDLAQRELKARGIECRSWWDTFREPR